MDKSNIFLSRTLLDGVFLHPADFYIDSDSFNKKTTDVDVLECANTGIPHFAVGTETRRLIDDDIEDDIIEQAMKVFPEIEDVLPRCTHPMFSPDHKLLNAERWNKAPHVGAFPVDEISRVDQIRSAGIIRSNDGMISTRLMNGRTLKVPLDWGYIYPSSAKNCNYAGVVEFHDKKYPHLVFFSQTPFLKENEEMFRDVYDAIHVLYPDEDIKEEGILLVDLPYIESGRVFKHGKAEIPYNAAIY